MRAREGYTNPVIELLTVGPGPGLVQRWGHAALCVLYDGEPGRDVCHNYGATSARSLTRLGWGFLRGTARFRVVLQSFGNVLDMYRGEDRSMWLQRLPFNQAQVDRMKARLEKDLLEENRHYVYHHMWDNCATRLRDHIDAVSGGALRRGGRRTTGMTFRDVARGGLAGRPLLLALSTIGLGRGLDRNVTEWASMAHPRYLREVVAKKLGARPEAVYSRRGPPLPSSPGYGNGLLLGLAILLLAGLVVTRRLGRFERLALTGAGSILFALGAMLWLVSLLTTVKELRYNEALTVFVPTDLLLLRLSGSRLQLYLRARLALLALVAGLLVAGVLVQPLLVAVLIPAGVCIALLRPPIWPSGSRVKTAQATDTLPPSSSPTRREARHSPGRRSR